MGDPKGGYLGTERPVWHHPWLHGGGLLHHPGKTPHPPSSPPSCCLCTAPALPSHSHYHRANKTVNDASMQAAWIPSFLCRVSSTLLMGQPQPAGLLGVNDKQACYIVRPKASFFRQPPLLDLPCCLSAASGSAARLGAYWSLLWLSLVQC